MKNRLYLMRKIRRLTQQQVADPIKVTQSAYSCWEKNKFNVNASTMARLAKLFRISVDFLSGRSYTVTFPVELWDQNLKENYDNASPEEKEYLIYLHGKIVYDDSAETINQSSCRVLIMDDGSAMIYHRDGSNSKKHFSKDQIEMLASMIEGANEEKDI